MKVGLLLSTAVFLYGCVHAQAQSVAGDAAARAEAPHFMAVTGKLDVAQTTANNMRLYIMATLARGGLDFDQRATLTETLILPDVKAALPRLVDEWTGIFAAQLSADDMRATEAFFVTEPGQRYLAAQNAITTSLQMATTTWESTSVRDAIAKNIDALHSHGYQD